MIGFIGNTGDAFTTSPHLHFEIHPRPLLHLGYDGAVDPTGYLDSWTHLAHVTVPLPTHPPLPTDPALKHEARYVFRELLAARHLSRHAPKASERPHIKIPVGANGPPTPPPPVRVSAAPQSSGGSEGGATAGIELVAGAVMLAVTALLLVPLLRRRASRREHEHVDESITHDG